ncbi:MAG: phospholipase D-like domain-containing protein [Candidatus Bathyarchaeia archaeon]
MLSKILQFLGQPEDTRVAVAFLSIDGYQELANTLRNVLSRGRHVKFIVGISRYHSTDWEALEKLLHLSKVFPNLEVKYYNNEGFHPKIFIFKDDNSLKVIVGSSNLTSAGLTKNVEANVLLDGEINEPIFGNISLFFDNLFKSASLLNDSVVRQYKSSYLKFNHFQRRASMRLGKTPLPSTSQLDTVREVRQRHDGLAYWKVAPGRDARLWSHLKSQINSQGNGFVAIGWPELDDLSYLQHKPEEIFKREIERRAETLDYVKDPKYVARQFWMFCREIKVGDIVVAYSRKHIYAIGNITSEYYHRTGTSDKERLYPHRRKVHWITIPEKILKIHLVDLWGTNDTVHAIKDEVTIDYINEEIALQHIRRR